MIWAQHENGLIVSDTGRVVKRKRGSRDYAHAKQGKRTGYPSANLRDGGKVSVHRLVAELFCERLPGQDVVRHLDGTRDNNRASNLAWGTLRDNSQDAIRHGTHPTASRNGNAVLTREQALQIKAAVETGELHSSIAQRFGVKPWVVNNLALGKAHSRDVGPVQYTKQQPLTAEQKQAKAAKAARVAERWERLDAAIEQAVRLRNVGVPIRDIAKAVGKSVAFVSAHTEGMWNGWLDFIAEQQAMGHSAAAVHRLIQAMILGWRKDVHPKAAMSVIEQREQAAGCL